MGIDFGYSILLRRRRNINGLRNTSGGASLFSISINGRNVGLNGFGSELEKELRKAAFTKVSAELHDRVGSIRHPETGEFPTVVVFGDCLEDMALRVEGSPKLIEIVKSRISEEDLQFLRFPLQEVQSVPKTFLSFGWEDKLLAQKIAECLLANGVDTWWAEWEIGAGDSLRRRIDSGLGECTHFIVLLTPTSIKKPWVNEEMDAGFMRKLGDKCRFIPLRHGLSPSELPPLLSGMFSPEIDAECTQLSQLVNDIHGISQKPPLGPAPTVVNEPRTGYSAAATAIAKVYVTESVNGDFADPQYNTASLANATGLSGEDLTDGLYELRHYFKDSTWHILVQHSLYSEFDQFWKPWKPAEDALKLAADLVNDPEMPLTSQDIAARYGWEPRRLNPAISYLTERKLVDALETIGASPFIVYRVMKNDATRRFVKSRG